jgi:hypothetical protein
MSLSIISEGLPELLESQLLGEEKVYYFSWITSKGGCLSSSSKEDYWIALTNKRAMYRAKIISIEDGGRQRLVEKDGVIPLEKISFIEVTDTQIKSGCTSTRTYELRISSSGGTVHIPILTKEKGYEIRKMYSEIAEKFLK